MPVSTELVPALNGFKNSDHRDDSALRVELLIDVLHVPAHGMNAHSQLRGDILGRAPSAKQSGDIPLASSELLDSRTVGLSHGSVYWFE